MLRWPARLIFRYLQRIYSCCDSRQRLDRIDLGGPNVILAGCHACDSAGDPGANLGRGEAVVQRTTEINYVSVGLIVVKRKPHRGEEQIARGVNHWSRMNSGMPSKPQRGDTLMRMDFRPVGARKILSQLSRDLRPWLLTTAPIGARIGLCNTSG